MDDFGNELSICDGYDLSGNAYFASTATFGGFDLFFTSFSAWCADI